MRVVNYFNEAFLIVNETLIKWMLTMMETMTKLSNCFYKNASI